MVDCGSRHFLGTERGGIQQASGRSGPQPTCRACGGSWLMLRHLGVIGACDVSCAEGSSCGRQACSKPAGTQSVPSPSLVRRPRPWKDSSCLTAPVPYQPKLSGLRNGDNVPGGHWTGDRRTACTKPVLSTVGSLGPAPIPGHRQGCEDMLHNPEHHPVPL